MVLITYVSLVTPLYAGDARECGAGCEEGELDERSTATRPRGDCHVPEVGCLFFIIAMAAGAMGFGGIAQGAAEIAQILFYIFLAICGTFIVAGILLAQKLTS